RAVPARQLAGHPSLLRGTALRLCTGLRDVAEPDLLPRLPCGPLRRLASATRSPGPLVRRSRRAPGTASCSAAVVRGARRATGRRHVDRAGDQPGNGLRSSLTPAYSWPADVPSAAPAPSAMIVGLHQCP